MIADSIGFPRRRAVGGTTFDGQEQFGFAGRERVASSLGALVSLIDWNQVAELLDPLYPATKSEPAWPPLAMFRALLLSIWYDLSDVKRDCQDFRVWAGIMGKKESHYVPTQRTGDTG